MRSDASSPEALLRARDERQALLDRLRPPSGEAVVALALNVPGREKSPPGAARLVTWALARVRRALPGSRLLLRHEDAAGPFALVAVAAPTLPVKRACLEVEEACPAARLVDLDVYGPDGQQLDRSAVGLPPRRCLLCDGAAADCIRARRHAQRHLLEGVRQLLADFDPEPDPEPDLALDPDLEPAADPARGPGPDRLAADLTVGLVRELALTPKPGLVDRLDSGSHPDLTYELMTRSIGEVGRAWAALARSAARGEPLRALLALGQASERRLHAACGTNTHKGALFIGGLLVVARRRLGGERAGPGFEAALRDGVREVAREILGGRRLPRSHGATARRRFGVGGVVAEALAGFPSIFEVALPAWRGAVARGHRGELADFAALAALMERVEDTTALHRCGPEGLARVRRDGAALARRLAEGQDHRRFLRDANRAWRELGLTMGGVADLLGVSLGLLRHLGELDDAGRPAPPAGARRRAGRGGGPPGA
jgi:triphosphoribosyl-dephospho-CoA synthase